MDGDQEGRPLRREKAANRKAEVLEAAVDVIVERGLAGTRYSDVAEASGVSVGTLQYYFLSREELLLATFRHGTASDRQAMKEVLAQQKVPWVKLKIMFEAQINSIRPSVAKANIFRTEYFRAALRNPELRDDVLLDYKDWLALLSSIIAEGVERGDFTTSANPDDLALVIISIFQGTVLPLALEDPDTTVDDIRRIVYDSVSELIGRVRKSAPKARAGAAKS